jgi:predicted dehydrogenase
MKIGLGLSLGALVLLAACQPGAEEAAPMFTGADDEVRLMTLNPGHFHAGLVQKYDYDQVDRTVHVYAPGGDELESHLALVEQFNARADDPTDWTSEVYQGEDYLERMLDEKPGNVMVVSGNNARKIEYIRRAIGEGVNVLADKPMVIYPDDFSVLTAALASADSQGLLVNDIMTERHEITSILQRALSQDEALFGELVEGSPEAPAITKESVHYFYKNVAGQPLVRPAWFFDVDQQGKAIVDVSTHLVDLILWQAFPGEPISYADPSDGVEVLSARSWATELTPTQFERVTHKEAYPAYLMPDVEGDSILHIEANGEFVFKVRDVHGKVAVRWGYENPTGGDTHYSIMRGTKANLVIRQDEAQDYQATLYVEPAEGVDPEAFETTLTQALENLSDRYAGLSVAPSAFGWEIQIPEQYKEGHEEHFTRVTEQYLDYLVEGTLPVWERANLETKYYITTQAFALSD